MLTDSDTSTSRTIVPACVLSMHQVVEFVLPWLGQVLWMSAGALSPGAYASRLHPAPPTKAERA